MFRMAGGVMEQYISQCGPAQAAPEVTFARQGPEPTLVGLGSFRLAVQLQEGLLPIWPEAVIDGTHRCEIAACSDQTELRHRRPGCRRKGDIDAALGHVQPLLEERGLQSFD
jgi:hypothetical protein